MLNVSPTGDRSRYFYFAYEPEPTSFNEAEHGFITDYLHPRYGWNDESWNGAWTFVTKLVSRRTGGSPWRSFRSRHCAPNHRSPATHGC